MTSRPQTRSATNIRKTMPTVRQRRRLLDFGADLTGSDFLSTAPPSMSSLHRSIRIRNAELDCHVKRIQCQRILAANQTACVALLLLDEDLYFTGPKIAL